MQLAFEPNEGLLAVVLARDARGKVSEGRKRKPVVHVFEVNDGRELWKRELESEVEMMPAQWSDDGDALHARQLSSTAISRRSLYLFYEGLTSVDALTGKNADGKFRIKEACITEATRLRTSGQFTFPVAAECALSPLDGEEFGKRRTWA